MPNKNYRVYGYRIVTKKYKNIKPDENDCFDLNDLEIFIYLISKLWQKNKELVFDNKSGNGKKLLYIDEILESTDDYIFGKFKTGAFGTTEDFRDSNTNKITYNKKEHETSDDDVFFYIGKKYGEILIGNDPNNSITKNSLQNYFKLFEPLLEDYRVEFNDKNEKKHQIYRNRMFYVQNLPPIDFFDELNKFDKVKNGSFIIKEKDITDTIDVNKKLKDLDDKIDINNEDVEIEIKLRNISAKKLTKEYKKLFEILTKVGMYDNFKVLGKHRNGDTKTITKNIPIRSFDTKVDFGSKRYPINYIQVKNEFIKVCRENQLLFGKVYPTKDIDSLDEIEMEDVKKIIHKRALEKNMNSLIVKRDEKFKNAKYHKKILERSSYKNDFRSIRFYEMGINKKDNY